MDFSAEWIWLDDGIAPESYNQLVVFRRDFRLEEVPVHAKLMATADTWFRLKVNGQWLDDGPARSYPEHYSYDVLEPDGLFRAGINRLEADVRFFGCGTFHQLPQRGGFLAQLELDFADGRHEVIGTGPEWQAHRSTQLLSNTPKMSIQNGPYEIFDATRPDTGVWSPAAVVDNPPWSGLTPRETPTLTRKEAQLIRVIGVKRVKHESTGVSVALDRWIYPDFITEGFRCMVGICAFEFNSPQKQKVVPVLHNTTMTINGAGPDKSGAYKLESGKNVALIAPKTSYGHDIQMTALFPAAAGIADADYGPIYGTVIRDCICLIEDVNGDKTAHNLAWERFVKVRDTALQLTGIDAFKAMFTDCQELKEPIVNITAPALDFEYRSPSPSPAADVDNPQALVYPDDRCAVIHPVDGSDIELCCDLGEQNVGYWNFALTAAAGTVVDIAAVEYITSDGVVQPTGPGYRNSMRYICKEGFNRYTSIQRRSGRYIFITLRRMTSPVRFQSFRLVESTYPVIPEGGFHCSDSRLDSVYDISRRTLKLCMEDTFTDCPLYEQTLWIGDARSEGLFAMSTFGAYDLVRRCIEIGAQSLDHLPMVACQAPSGWSRLIPIWSFMWSLSVGDYYRETGDLEFVKKFWPAVKTNLERSIAHIDGATGLFRMKAWNLFDWSRTDCNPETMLQNSFFLVGALHDAQFLANELGDAEFAAFCDGNAAKLVAALDRVWDTRRLAYPDSLDNDGKPCRDIAVHTSMLAALYDAAAPEYAAAIRTNTLVPRHELIPVSSAFAALYYYQAMEKLGQPEAIIDAIRRDYFPMLEIGSTTVWESFPIGTLGRGEFPTRSHCHGWSATPLYFLPRLVLGIRPDGVGGKKFIISPVIGNLEYASGSRATVNGRIEVKWQKTGERKIVITASAPAGVELRYELNDTLADFEVEFNAVVRDAIL